MIGGRFTLGPPIGRGGMGTVHEAYDERLRRQVALKQLSFSDDLSKRRFRREARLAARLNHPGVPAIYDLGDDYIAMEYVDGYSLHDLIAETAPVSVAWVAAIGLQIAAVLVCAHRESLIHRDLKPSNVLIMGAGAVKVIDFGIATLTDGVSQSSLTPPGVVLGTSSYRAPECEIGPAGPRSDLYALGRILHELGGEAVSTVASQLTAVEPLDRPASAHAVVEMLRPMVAPLSPLPSFVPDQDRVLHITDAYLTLADALPRRSMPARQARAEAERLIADHRYSEAIALLDRTIAATTGDSLELDLRRDLARALFESGDLGRAAIECQDLIPRLVLHLGPDHAAVWQAQAWQREASRLDKGGRPPP